MRASRPPQGRKDRRADRIKAYSIAIEVFGRDASFDAQNDPVVRIEAGRIRRALERYYLTAGRTDPILISIPKGSYMPVFEPNGAVGPDGDGEAQPAAVATPPTGSNQRRLSWALAGAACLLALLVAGFWLAARFGTGMQDGTAEGPRLIVQPFQDLTGTRDSVVIARGLTDEVIGQIARYREIVVVAGASPDGSAPNDVSGRFQLDAGVRIEGGRLRLTARLVNRSDGTVVWSEIYDEALDVSDLLDLQTRLARAVTTALAEPYGVIFKADAANVRDTPPDDLPAYQCTLAYYTYRSDMDSPAHKSVQACLKRAVERFPAYGTAWALLSLTYIDEIRFRYRLGASSQPSLDLAAVAAKRAMASDPQNVRGMEAEMLVLFFRREFEAALAVGARARKLNPNDTELAAEYAFRMALYGNWDEGCKLLGQALDRNPGPAGFYELGLALCGYMKRDYADAVRWLTASNLPMNPNFHFVRAAIAGQLGDEKQGAEELEWIRANALAMLTNARAELAIRIIRPEDQAHFIDGLIKAGLPIVPP